jgi:hypothetical protein
MVTGGTFAVVDSGIIDVMGSMGAGMIILTVTNGNDVKPIRIV